MNTWDKMTEDEKKWIAERGWSRDDVNENPPEATINTLWLEYATRGYILHDAEAMARRLRK